MFPTTLQERGELGTSGTECNSQSLYRRQLGSGRKRRRRWASCKSWQGCRRGINGWQARFCNRASRWAEFVALLGNSGSMRGSTLSHQLLDASLKPHATRTRPPPCAAAATPAHRTLWPSHCVCICDRGGNRRVGASPIRPRFGSERFSAGLLHPRSWAELTR